MYFKSRMSGNFIAITSIPYLQLTVSGFTGAVIPITLCRIGFDPAVASGPLITTVNDVVALVSYHSLAWILLLK